jgi:haloalkane dehalogenase
MTRVCLPRFALLETYVCLPRFALLETLYKKRLKNMKFAQVVIVLTIILAGCASNGAKFAAAHDAYLTRFNAAHPHALLSLTRKDGHTISVREFGARNRGHRPSLVVMHGFPDNQHLYDLVIPLLASKFHVVSFDFLGWGGSEKPAEHLYDIASLRADLELVIEGLKLEQVVIVVHDLSGQPGIDWALDNERKTAALVLLNTYYNAMPTLKAPEAIAFYAKPSWLRDLAVWGANKSASRFQNGVASQIDKFLTNAEVSAEFIPLFAHTAPDIRPAFFSATAVLWQEIAAREANLSRMRRFAKPVLVLFGEKDPYLNPGVAREFAGQFANAKLQLIGNAGHYVQLDQAQMLAQILLEQLDSPTSQSPPTPVL